MFIGHYGPAFLIKRRFPEVPLWALFLASQGCDIVFFALSFLGLEKYRLIDGETGPLRLDLYHHPYSHSLVGVMFVALLIWRVFRRLGKKSMGIALAMAYFSHWVLDSIVHIGDLPLLTEAYKVGLGLWEYQSTAFAVETMIPIVCFWIFRKSIILSNRDCFYLGTLVVSLVFYTYIIPLPPVVWGFMLLAFTVFTLQALSVFHTIEKGGDNR